MSIITNLSVR